MQQRRFAVPAMSCHHCVMAIENELTDIPGVETVEADVETKQVTVTWKQPATWEQISLVLEEIGYPAEV